MPASARGRRTRPACPAGLAPEPTTTARPRHSTHRDRSGSRATAVPPSRLRSRRAPGVESRRGAVARSGSSPARRRASSILRRSCPAGPFAAAGGGGATAQHPPAPAGCRQARGLAWPAHPGWVTPLGEAPVGDDDDGAVPDDHDPPLAGEGELRRRGFRGPCCSAVGRRHQPARPDHGPCPARRGRDQLLGPALFRESLSFRRPAPAAVATDREHRAAARRRHRQPDAELRIQEVDRAKVRRHRHATAGRRRRGVGRCDAASCERHRDPGPPHGTETRW